MADVFISYARLDRSLAEPIKTKLEALGLSVFFDIDGGIDAGDAFPVRIGDAVSDAKIVLALWTPHALTREWCRKECHLAQQLQKLIPAGMSPLSPSDLREFVASSYEDLSDYAGQPQHFGWSQVLMSIARKLEAWAQACDDAAGAAGATEAAKRVRSAATAARPPTGAPSAAGQSGAAAVWEKVDKNDAGDLLRFAETFIGTTEAFEARRRMGVLREAALLPQEVWAWARIRRGLTADMSRYPGTQNEGAAAWLEGVADGAARDAASDEPWPEHRTLTETFLRTLVFNTEWAAAKERPGVTIVAANLEEAIDWSGRDIREELILANCRFNKPLLMIDARVGSSLNFTGSAFRDEVCLDRARIDGSVYLRQCTTKIVRLFSAQVGGDLHLNESRLDGDVQMDGVATQGSVFFRGANVSGDLRLLRSRVGGIVAFEDASTHDVSAYDAEVGGSVYLRSTRAHGRVAFAGAKIGGDLQLSESTFEGDVDLSEARISGDLQLSQIDGRGPAWSDGARLLLSNTKVRALAGDVQSFPGQVGRRANKAAAMDLVGLEYERLGTHRMSGTLARASTPQLLRWLASGDTPNEFSPSPYRQLARALSDQGQQARAAQILYAMRRRQTRSEPNLLRKVGLWFADILVGYGLRNERAILWFVGVVAAGAIYGMYQAGALSLAPGSITDWLRWASFSLDNALPFIQLDPGNPTFLADRFAGGDARNTPVNLVTFFAIHQIFALLILSYLAAGVTGLSRGNT